MHTTAGIKPIIPFIFALLILGTAGAQAQNHSAPAKTESAESPRQDNADQHCVVPGPQVTQQLIDELAEQDRRLFDLVFIRCDADALAGMLADDFAFYHDKSGEVAASPQKFVENIRSGCEAQAKGTNVRARRELVQGTMEAFPLNDYGAIQTGSHRFFGIEPGKPDQLRETGKFFHVWKRVDGQWKLSRVYSFDHHPAQ